MRRVALRALAAATALIALSAARSAGSGQTALTDSTVPPPATDETPSPAPVPRRCPSEMVDILGRFCIDRWEISLTDATSGRPLSPYYNPTPFLARRDHRDWQRRARRTGPMASRSVPLPPLEAFQLDPGVVPRAVSRPDRVPAAYLDLPSARRACEQAGKRLCRRDEWLFACRGEHQVRFGYGDRHDPARCNLAAPVHPASLLHGGSTLGLTDPRLNQVEYRGRSLLRPTGSLLGCATPWGDDAVYDMIGNLDEWIDDPAGTFVGGFYARDTRWGCDARIEVHSPDYYDYSIGARCCSDAASGPGTPPGGAHTR